MIPNPQLSGIYDQLVTTVKELTKLQILLISEKNCLLSGWLVVWGKKIWKLVWKLKENHLKSLTIWRYVHFLFIELLIEIFKFWYVLYHFKDLTLNTFLFGDSQRSKNTQIKPNKKRHNWKWYLIHHFPFLDINLNFIFLVYRTVYCEFYLAVSWLVKLKYSELFNLRFVRNVIKCLCVFITIPFRFLGFKILKFKHCNNMKDSFDKLPTPNH